MIFSSKNSKQWVVLLLFIAGCLFIGWLGGEATETSRLDWYSALRKPFLNPPDWVFGPVWTLLYVFIAVAGWRLWVASSSGKSPVKFLFFSQLALNGIWSFLFFGLRSPLAGLLDIIALWFLLLILVRLTWREERVSFYLLAPYFLWVSFATYLNFSIFLLNLR